MFNIYVYIYKNNYLIKVIVIVMNTNNDENGWIDGWMDCGIL